MHARASGAALRITHSTHWHTSQQHKNNAQKTHNAQPYNGTAHKLKTHKKMCNSAQPHNGTTHNNTHTNVQLTTLPQHALGHMRHLHTARYGKA